MTQAEIPPGYNSRSVWLDKVVEVAEVVVSVVVSVDVFKTVVVRLLLWSRLTLFHRAKCWATCT